MASNVYAVLELGTSQPMAWFLRFVSDPLRANYVRLGAKEPTLVSALLDAS